MNRLTGLMLAALCSAGTVRGQSPYLVKDINATANATPGSDPRHVRAADDRVYFLAQAGGGASRGFWRTGGTPETTTLILDALSGAEPNVATIGNVGYFAFADLEHGIELWRTDGTAAGTGLVRDIVRGTAPSAPNQVTAAGSLVYFIAFEGAGVGLWRSDGTAAGTIPLSSGGILSPTAAGSILYFIRSSLETGQELWRSDGTPAGTHILEDTCPGSCSSSPTLLTPVGNRLFYIAYSPTFGDEVRVTDGTTTQVVADLVPGGLGPGVESMAGLGSSLVFSTFSSGIFRTDGTPGGTEMISPLRGRELTSAAANVFFEATTPAFGSELWRTDGSAAGTAMVGDLCPGTCGFFDTSIGTLFVGSPQRLYFIRYNGTTSDLWRSDGSQAGTFIVKGSAVAIQRPVVLGNSLVFVAEPPATGRELWATDGTTAGTVPLTEAVSNSSDVERPTIVGNRMFFRAFEPASGRDLWVTEGTEATTRLIDVAPGTGHTLPQWPTALGDRLLTDLSFALPPSSANGLWISDGTTAGTTRLGPQMNLTTPSANGADALFLGSPLSFDYELWKTDGTAEGTVRLKDLSPGGFTNEGRFLPALGEIRFVSVNGSAPGLWRSDGTAEGTIQLAPVFPTEGVALGGGLILNVGGQLWRTDGWPQGTSLLSAAPQFVRRLTATGGRAFFVAYSAAAGYELWATDGTAAGTAMVKDINPGPSDAFPLPLFGAAEPPFVELNGLAYFVAADDVRGFELWRSDGTETGTVLVGETAPGLDSAIMGPLNAAGGRLFVQGYSLADGRELWSSDGTSVMRYADVAPGPYSSAPDQLRSDGRRLYFVADDGVHGAEPWALDLPPALSVDDVTVVEGDAPPGVASFSVRLASPIVAAATVAFATADGSAHAGSDYLPISGLLTFAPGPPQTQRVDVPPIGDLGEEADETFVLRLSSPAGVAVANGEAVALVQDDDVPQVALTSTTILEGDTGTTGAVVGVALVTKNGAPTTLPKTIEFATEPGTAAAGIDFLPTAGALTFPAATVSGASTPVPVTVVGDELGEDDETFALRVVATSALQPLSVATPVVIQDDDGGIPEPVVELGHGSTLRHSFDVASSRTYRLLQEQHSSYELRLDEVSGDVQPVELNRIGPDGSQIVQVGEPDGTGGSVAMRWANATSSAVGDQTIRAASAACEVECGPDDTYRLRAWDTTLRAPRFNNTGSQRTILLLQNRSAGLVRAHVAYWRADGVLAGTSIADLQPHGALVLDTSQHVPDLSGSVTVSHTAGYAGLAGKLVTIEAATGFSFDTPLLPRPR